MPPKRPTHVSQLCYFTLPSPRLAFACTLRAHTTALSCSSSWDKSQGGHRGKGRTSTPGHYSKQKASPAGLCSTRAAVNETIYCIPISVQPLDPRTASPIVLSALIKAGSSRVSSPFSCDSEGAAARMEGASLSCGALCRTRNVCYPGDSFPQQRGEWKLLRCPPQSSTSIANADARRDKCWQAECLPASLSLPQDTGINQFTDSNACLVLQMHTRADGVRGLLCQQTEQCSRQEAP